MAVVTHSEHFHTEANTVWGTVIRWLEINGYKVSGRSDSVRQLSAKTPWGLNTLPAIITINVNPTGSKTCQLNIAVTGQDQRKEDTGLFQGTVIKSREKKIREILEGINQLLPAANSGQAAADNPTRPASASETGTPMSIANREGPVSAVPASDLRASKWHMAVANEEGPVAEEGPASAAASLEGVKYCAYCGKPIAAADMRFCAFCGKPLGANAAPVAAESAAWEYAEIHCRQAGMHMGSSLVGAFTGSGNEYKYVFVVTRILPTGESIETPGRGEDTQFYEFASRSNDPVENFRSNERYLAEPVLDNIRGSLRQQGFEEQPRGPYWFSYRFRKRYIP